MQVEADIKGLDRNAMGDFTRYLNVYSLLTTGDVYDGQRATRDQRVFTLTRSHARPGPDGSAMLPSAGLATRPPVRARCAQIAGGLNVAMPGLRYRPNDTDEFFVNAADGERNAAYRELFGRWNQFSVFPRSTQVR